jgi:hypothetical protein
MGFNLKLEDNTQKSQFTFETNEDPIIGKKYVPQVWIYFYNFDSSVQQWDSFLINLSVSTP